MIARIRAFLAVIEEGSLHRAAVRLRASQSALTRQMQALEHELGGPLLDRSSTGVRPTAAGRELAAQMRPLLASYDTALGAVRRALRGETAQIRIGYLASAAKQYLAPALATLRRTHPELKVKLLDLSPGEQIAALRRGEIDVGLTDESGQLLGREFYVRTLAVSPGLVALPTGHPLAGKKWVWLRELAGETFIEPPDDAVPGFSPRLVQLCRQHGKFRPRLVRSQAGAIESLTLVANEEAVGLLPGFLRIPAVPGVKLVPLADPGVRLPLLVVWSGGRKPGAVRTLVDALFPPKRA